MRKEKQDDHLVSRLGELAVDKPRAVDGDGNALLGLVALESFGLAVSRDNVEPASRLRDVLWWHVHLRLYTYISMVCTIAVYISVCTNTVCTGAVHTTVCTVIHLSKM